MKTGRLLVVGVAVASLFLGGCATTYRYDEPVVRVAPPPPYVEYVGAPPVVGNIWITGYWNWGGARYAWVPGRWEAPRPGYQWVPHRWEHEGDHWRQSGGRWEHGGGRPEPQVAARPEPRDNRDNRDNRDHRAAPQVMPQQPLRVQPREVPRAEPETDRRGGRDSRPGPERNVNAAAHAPVASPAPSPREIRPQQPPPQAVARSEPPRGAERNDARPSPERSRGAEANERGGNSGRGNGQDDRANREKKRSDERGGDASQRDDRR